ncbi:MAG: response regulator [Treponema sp.]|jgi:signal transduction histidine kinase/DNA-binding NarL/FixJ family response regulator|nr:response regulator [Treponema sp.]
MRIFSLAESLCGRVKNALFPGTLDFRAKIFTVLAVAGFLISVSTALIGIANGAGAGNVTAGGIAALLAAVLLVYSKRSGRYRLCYIITVAGVFIGLFPFMFFSAGGYHSGMPVFFVFAVIFTIFMLEGGTAAVMALLELAIYTGISVYACYRPGAVTFFKNEEALLADVIFGFVTVSLALGITMFLQIRLYRDHQRELETAREEALRSSRVKSAFLSNMSHEIRTPINVILGMNEMILRTNEWEQRDPAANEAAHYARAIESAGKTLLALVNNVLDMSRIESGKMELNEGPYKTAELVRELFVMEQETAARKDLAFTVEADENLPSELFGDETRIKQVALNFLSNAFKYTEKGGVVLRVKGRGGPGNFRLCIEVEDTGIGIREEQKPGLFGIFTRLDTEQRRNIEGSGLGLAIAKELAGLMGGSIGVESVWGRGSVFTLELPQGVLNAGPAGSFLAGETAVRREYGFTAPDARILAVDDNAENLEVLRALLARTGIQVDTVRGGAECLAAVQRETYHAVIMDYIMPGMDGIETFRRLREDAAREAAPETPVIVLTAHTALGTAGRFLDEGFAACLAKPVTGAGLEAALLRILPPGLVRRGAALRQGEPFSPTTPAYGELARAMAEHGVVLEQGLRYFSGDAEQYRKTAAVFLKNYPERKSELQRLVEKRDWTGLWFRAHSLKSSAKTAGARNLGETAARLEAYCSNSKDAGGGDALIEGAAALLFAEWEEMKQGLELFVDESL